MSRSRRHRHDKRIGALALLSVTLLVASAQHPLTAASKNRRARAGVKVTEVSTKAVPTPPPAPAPVPAPASDPAGYWIVGSDGGVYAYGSAPFKGSTGAMKLNRPVVGLAPTPSGEGYWLVASDGGIFSFGDASFRGSTGAITLNKPIVGMTSTPSGKGYWLVASDGGIFAFGDAAFKGSTGAMTLNRPIVGMSATKSGQGYWLVASDGGIFAFGDAVFSGSTGNLKLVRGITGMATTPGGRGYWLTASDGGVFAFGDARFHGAARDRILTPESGRGVVAVVPTKTGGGYWQVAASGKVFAFGDAAAGLGSPTSARSTIVGMAARGTGPGAPAAITNVKATAVLPSGPAPQFFSSSANLTWGMSPSEEEKDKAGKGLALAEAGNRVFVGGEFAGMVPPGATTPSGRRDKSAPTPITTRPYLAALDATTGTVLDWDVHPDGPVLALAVSADRRTLYVGGKFTQIAGAPVPYLAAIDIETGTLDADFKAPAISDTVRALAVSGNTLYVGGGFTRVGDADRQQVAAFDATTGALRTGFVPPANGGGRYTGHTGTESHDGKDGTIHDLGVTSDGRYLVVGGDFLDFGDRSGLVILDGATGQPAPWQPEMDRPVFGVAMWPGDSRTFFVSTGGSGGTVQAFLIQDGASAPAPVVEDDDGHGHRSRSHRNRDDSSSSSKKRRAALGPQDRRRLHGRGGHDRAGHPRRPLRLRPRRQHGLWVALLHRGQGRGHREPAYLRVRAEGRRPRHQLHRAAEHAPGALRGPGRRQQPLRRRRLHRGERQTAARLRTVPRHPLTQGTLPL